MASYPELHARSRQPRSRQPRPILKSLPEFTPLPFSTYPLDSPHVHFPPTPNLTSTTFTHAAGVYDRAPITVSENVCALPERGGRCYMLQSQGIPPSGGVEGRYDDSRRRRDSNEFKGNYFHPRAFKVCEVERDNNHPDRYESSPPIPDLLSTHSSTSSDSSSPSTPSDFKSDSSYGSLTTSSIPTLSSNLSLDETSSVYPLETSVRDHHGCLPWQAYYSPCNQAIVSYVCPASVSESKSKKTVHGRKMARSKGCGETASRLAKFGGGFSDQAIVLEGCLGGF